MADNIKSRLRVIHWVGASAMLLLLGSAVGLGAYPMYMGGRDSIAKSRYLKQQLAELDGLDKTLQGVEADLKKTEERLKQSEKRLPTRNEMDQFMGELAAVAKDAGLTVEGINPKPVQPSGDYRVLPVEISGGGSYQQVYKFLAGLRRMQRLTRLDDVTMDAEQKTGEGSQPGEKAGCRVRVLISTFMAR